MLEVKSLLIRPWHVEPARTLILDARSGGEIGCVYRRPRIAALSWLCCWKRFVLAIHETDDEPLLMSVQQSYAPWDSWLVQDADGGRVGRVTGPRLFDGVDRPLAMLHEADGVGTYRGEQRDLGEIRGEEEGVCLTFLMEEKANPFTKMVLLAAALIHTQSLRTGPVPHEAPPTPRFRQ